MSDTATANANRRGILAVGNLLIDKMKTISGYPREAMLTHIEATETSCGGGCMNVLFDLATIDPSLPLHLAGMVGDDSEAEYIIQQANKHSVNTDYVQQVNDAPTSFTDVMINKSSGQRTFFHHSGANARLDTDFIGQLDTRARIAHLAYLLVLPELDQDDSEFGSKGARALAQLQSIGYKTSLDLVSDADATRFDRWVKPALKFVDYLIINDEEASSLTGLPVPEKGDTAGFERQAEQLMALGVKDVVVIHHPSGATGLKKAGKAVSVHAYTVNPEEIISTLGAGDAFCAGTLYGLHEDMDLVNCLKLGCASARFNLFSLSATDGAQPFEVLSPFIDQWDTRVK